MRVTNLEITLNDMTHFGDDYGSEFQTLEWFVLGTFKITFSSRISIDKSGSRVQKDLP